MSTPMEGPNYQIRQVLCRGKTYKYAAVVITAFIVLQYTLNIFVYNKQNTPKSVPSGFSWILKLSPNMNANEMNINVVNKSVSETKSTNGDYSSSSSKSVTESVSASVKSTSSPVLLQNQSGSVEVILKLSNESLIKSNPRSNISSSTGLVPGTTVSTVTSTKDQLCSLIPPNLVGHLKVLTEGPPFEELEKLFPDLQPGGRFKPPDCISRHRVAIIVPYRDREQHLRVFLHNMHYMLMRQQLDYGIFIVEQAAPEKFNRAKLMNIGFAEALKLYDYQCFIFHDVDLIPEDDRNLYTCPEQPRHMSVAIDIFKYRLPYEAIFGGVSALKKEHMLLINGFSNEFWGWGGEDDDMSYRLKYYKLKITRYPKTIARYKMLKHAKDTPNPDRYKFLYKGRLRYKTDGLNSLKYKRLDLVFKKLYTWILVDVNPK